METEKEYPDGDKADCIIKASTTFDIEKLKNQIIDLDVSNEDLFYSSLETIYKNLIDENDSIVDSVGIWISFDDGTEIDNSIKMSVLDDMIKYSDGEIVPIVEFAKITFKKYEN